MTAIPSEIRTELDKLEGKHSANPEGRYFVPLANAYRKAGEVSRAIEVLQQGLSRHPDYVSAHIVLARCLSDRGEVEAAVAEFRRVLQLDGQNLVALRTLGEIASNAGDAEQARTWFEHLLAVDPMNEEARRALEAITPAAPAGGAGKEAGAAAVDALEVSTGDEGLGGYDHGFDPFGDFSADFDGNTAPSVDLDHSELGPEPSFEGGDVVVTETIAELYTRQGFYDRAADVYRELIRRRGRDDRLEGLLARVERLAAGGDETESEEVRGVDVEFLPDPFADSFATGFPSDATVGEPSPRPATIRDHLRAVVAWAPGAIGAGIDRQSVASGLEEYGEFEPGPTPANAPEAPFTVAPEPEDEVFVETPPWDDSGSSLAAPAPSIEPPSWGQPPAGGEADEFQAGVGEEPPSATDEVEVFDTTEAVDTVFDAGGTEFADAATVETTDAVETPEVGGAEDSSPAATGRAVIDDDDLFPWEIPLEEEPSEPLPAIEVGGDEPRSTFGSIEPVPPTAPDEPESAAMAEEGSHDAAEEPSEPPSRGEPSSAADGSGHDDDDDLESFQAWLRSLKR